MESQGLLLPPGKADSERGHVASLDPGSWGEEHEVLVKISSPVLLAPQSMSWTIRPLPSQWGQGSEKASMIPVETFLRVI